jgi:hypothetical protein
MQRSLSRSRSCRSRREPVGVEDKPVAEKPVADEPVAIEEPVAKQPEAGHGVRGGRGRA